MNKSPRILRWKRFCGHCWIGKDIPENEIKVWWQNPKIKKSCCDKKECWSFFQNYFISEINYHWELTTAEIT